MKKRFNVVDALLLVLIAGAVAASIFFLRTRNTFGAAETAPKSFTMEIRKTPIETVRAAEAAGVGSNVYRSTDGTYVGTLSAVRYQPAVECKYAQSLGRYVSFECPGLYDLYLDVTGEGTESETDIALNGVTVKIGQEFFIKGKGYASGGYLVGVSGSGAAGDANAVVGTGDQMVTYKVRFDNVRTFTVEGFHLGDTFRDPQTEAMLGTVTNIEVVPYATPEVNEKGEGIMAENPERYTVFVTLRGACTETANSYYIDGRNELKVGAELRIQSKYVECSMSYHELLKIEPLNRELGK